MVRFSIASDPRSLVVAFLLLIIAAVGGVVLRRSVFHPLSKFPGPWYHAVSGLPAIWVLLTLRQFAYYKKLHEKYGPVVRVAPNELSFASGTAMEDIYGWNKGTPPTEKSPVFTTGAPYIADPYLIVTAPGEAHKRLRRGLANTFATSALLREEVLVQSQLNQLVASLAARASSADGGDGVIDMTAWAKYFAFDTIGTLSFGRPFGCLKDGETNTDWIRSIGSALKMASYIQAAKRILGPNSSLQPYLVDLLMPSSSAQKAFAFQTVRAFKTIRERLADVDSEHHDFVYHILRNNESRNLLTTAEIEKNLYGFIIAGSEMVGLNLTVWAYHMGTNRKAYYKLRDLIRGRFSSASDINWASLKDMEYLDAVLHETIRTFGNVAQRLRIAAPGGMRIDGHFVPGGTSVAVADYAAAHLDTNFRDADKFVPERWLDASYSTDNKAIFKPFASGPRDCIGKSLAGIEMRLFIAHVLWHFELEVHGMEAGGRNEGWGPQRDWASCIAGLAPVVPALWVKLTKVAR